MRACAQPMTAVRRSVTERLRENVFKRLCDRGLAKSPAAWLLYKSVFLKYLRFVVGFRRFGC